MASIKNTFQRFHTFREYFQEYGVSYILKFNEFYSAEKFDEFYQTLSFLLEEGLLEICGDDVVNIYVYRLHQMQIEASVHRIYRLTSKGREIMSVLPASMNLPA